MLLLYFSRKQEILVHPPFHATQRAHRHFLRSFTDDNKSKKKHISGNLYTYFFRWFYLVQPCAICLGQIQVFRVRQNNISVNVTNIWECCIGGMEAYPRNSKEKRSSKRILPHPYCSTPPLPPTIFSIFFFSFEKKTDRKKKSGNFFASLVSRFVCC